MDGMRPAAAHGSRDELVRRAAEGDVAAFARIIRLNHEAMTRAALVVTGDLDRAAAATEAALLEAWSALRHPRRPTDLEAWLSALAVVAAMRLVSPGGVPGPGRSRRSPAAAVRAVLALRHVVGLPVAEIARVLRRPGALVAEDLARLPLAATVQAGSVAAVPVRPIDADALARRARSEEAIERERRMSVAICMVVGALFAWHPYLLGILAGR